MMTEPFKNEPLTQDKMLPYVGCYCHEDLDMFKKEDIKSAVEWLKEELENMKSKSMPPDMNHFIIFVNQAIEDCIKKIDKAFEGLE